MDRCDFERPASDWYVQFQDAYTLILIADFFTDPGAGEDGGCFSSQCQLPILRITDRGSGGIEGEGRYRRYFRRIGGVVPNQ